MSRSIIEKDVSTNLGNQETVRLCIYVSIVRSHRGTCARGVVFAFGEKEDASCVLLRQMVPQTEDIY